MYSLHIARLSTQIVLHAPKHQMKDKERVLSNKMIPTPKIIIVITDDREGNGQGHL